MVRSICLLWRHSVEARDHRYFLVLVLGSESAFTNLEGREAVSV